MMSNYICNITCSYRQPSGYCGKTGVYETCQYRQLHVEAKPFGNGIDVCPVCGKPSTIGKTITNADRIRSMTDEELAEWIADKTAEAGEFQETTAEWLDWLREVSHAETD